ncbi:MAG: NADH-quinone oxidoreductase subunit N [Candidatus Parvarchaeota archaeon]|nr:NADH-quinone oxidoreductase subunit N [Candidatus Parvarchaeota archaeon]MCL5101494.1 NADH-quinone oxidoreductase subunit N [Candidatus Parvarchaeota archaeon]
MINSEYVLFAGALVLILIDFLRKTLGVESKKSLHYATLILLFLAFIVELFYGDMNLPFFSSTQYTGFINSFILFIALAIYAFFLVDSEEHSAFMDFLFVFATLGALLVVISSNLIALAVSIELISLASYGLVFFQKSDRRMEGAMKFVVLGFLSFVIMLFGISLVYSGSGTLDFTGLSIINYVPFIGGIALLMVGLSFKSTIVPFHMWAPDVYEASNGTVTAFLSSVSKTAGLVAMIRVFFYAFPVSSQFVSIMFIILAISTIFFSSFLATVQDKIKRILAYSSISQAGFAFVGVSVLNTQGISSAVFYIFTFAIADALIFLSYKIFEDNKIIYKKDMPLMPAVSKIATICFFIGILSLAGFPPTMGFFGKLLIFSALLQNGYITYVIALFVILLFSTFYYFGLLRELILEKSVFKIQKISGNLHAKEAILIILTIALFIGVIFVGL